MRSSQVTTDSFTILSDVGDMIGGVAIIDRKMVEVAPAGFYGEFGSLPTVTPEMRDFAENEARRLGMLDDWPGSAT